MTESVYLMCRCNKCGAIYNVKNEDSNEDSMWDRGGISGMDPFVVCCETPDLMANWPEGEGYHIHYNEYYSQGGYIEVVLINEWATSDEKKDRMEFIAGDFI